MRYFVPSLHCFQTRRPLIRWLLSLHVRAILLPPFYLFYQDAGYGIKFLKDIPIKDLLLQVAAFNSAAVGCRALF